MAGGSLDHTPTNLKPPTPQPLPSPPARPPWWRALRRRLGDALAWLWRQEGTPGQRARGLAAGVFMGCFPFFGLQTLLGMALASLVRGNHLLAAAGTWISNPFTYVPLYWFNYNLGCRLLGQGRPWPGVDKLLEESLWTLGWEFGSRLLLGSAVVGAVAGLICGKLCWLLLRRGRPSASQQG